MATPEFDWQLLEPSTEGTGALVLRLDWRVRASGLGKASLVFLRFAPQTLGRFRQAYILAGGEGVRCPILPPGRIVVPAAAMGSPVYAELEPHGEPGEGMWLQVVGAKGFDGRDDVCYEVEVPLSAAQPASGAVLRRELETLARLSATGGTTRERWAYVQAVLDPLARCIHPQAASIRLALEANEAVASLEPDYRALARAEELSSLARQARFGDVEAVIEGVGALPKALRQLTEVQDLIAVAESHRAHPEHAEQRMLAEAQLARRDGDLPRAIAVCRGVDAASETWEAAHLLRLECAADLIEAALADADLATAQSWLAAEGEAFEKEVGADDPWLVSVRAAAGVEQGYDEDDVPYAEAAEPVVVEVARAAWSKLRSWLRDVRLPMPPNPRIEDLDDE